VLHRGVAFYSGRRFICSDPRNRLIARTAGTNDLPLP
jgi:hypothetical protein